MKDDLPVPGAVRPGGRTARTRAVVLAALRQELVDVGYAGVTVERVARRAGVHPATVYRRWRTVEGMVVELMTDLGNSEVPIPDTGSLDTDLDALARDIGALYADSGARAVVETIVGAATRSPRAEQALRTFFAARNRQAATIVARAISRGQLPPDTDGLEVIAALGAPFYYRMFITRQPLGPGVAARAAAAACVAARAGVFAAVPCPPAQASPHDAAAVPPPQRSEGE